MIDLRGINATVMDAMTTTMLVLFAIEATARVVAMTISAIKRAIKGEAE